MALNFELVDLGSVHKVAGEIKKLGNNARHNSEVLHLILLDMMKVEEAVFRSQGRRGGGSWKRLKDSTKEKKGMSKILYTAGANPNYSSYGDDTLVKSLTEEDAPFQISDTSNNTVLFGTSRPWAAVHQSGSEKRSIPARPFLRFTNYDMARWSRMLEAHLLRGFGTGD